MKNRQGGFTLIELMVVTAIIGLLANRAVIKSMGVLYKGKRAGVTLFVHAFRFACLSHYIDKGHYPNPAGTDISDYLKSNGYLQHTFSQAQRSWQQSHEPMLFAYKTDGNSYELSICFMGAGTRYLEERCVTVKDEGSIIYVKDPPSWASSS